MPSHYLAAQVLGATPPEGQRRLGLFRQPRPTPAIQRDEATQFFMMGL